MRKNKKQQHAPKEKSFFVSRTAASAAPRMTVECLDRYELLLGGCKKIEGYSPEETIVSTSSCTVRVKGQKISISFSGEGKILLCGRITSIEFI